MDVSQLHLKADLFQGVFGHFVGDRLGSINCYRVVALLVYVNFMFIGTLFYFAYRQKLTQAELHLWIVILMCLNTYSFAVGIKELFPHTPFNFFVALLAFYGAYLLRGYFRPFRVLGFLSSISFPLYALHPLVGYVGIRNLMAAGVPFPIAFLISLAVVLALSYVIHRAVELPMIQRGKARD